MEETIGVDGLAFKWGKKRGVGGKKKDVQFYESFTFDGDEYSLYDCVLVGNASEPDSSEPFVGKIIKIWEHTINRAKKVKLLWFFTPSEIWPNLKEVPEVLANELFLASGEGLGLANVNELEAISGKCSVVCISNDKRNPQPSDEDIKSADFVFRRAFDVGSGKVLDMIDDKIAGVDVKFLLNRAGCEKKATAVQEIKAGINGNPDALKPTGPSASCSVKIEKSTESSVKIEKSTESSEGRESSSDCKDRKEKIQDQLATKKSTSAEERFNKDSGVQEGKTHTTHDSCEVSGSTRNHCDGKAQESEVKKHFNKQKSMPAKEKDSNFCEASGSGVNHSNSKIVQVNDVKKQLTKQKSLPGEERYRKESNGLDDRPQKKQKLDGSVTVADGRNINSLQNNSSSGKKDMATFKRPTDRMTREEDPPKKLSFVKKQDLGVSVSEGRVTKAATEKVFSKKASFDNKPVRRAEDKMKTVNNERNYQVIEVNRRADAVKWFRTLPWGESSMREAEKDERLVLLQNLNPTYTSDEVEDIVYSALNEECTARMIEQTPATISHIGQALVIFKSREAAGRAVERLSEGCLLLSNGRPLVADFAKINPPGKPLRFSGHIKLPRTHMRREMRDAMATSHCSQPNNIEYDMALEWCLYQARSDLAIKRISKRQMEEKKTLQINFKPKLP